MPKILVADDNANIQKMVVLAFEERGIQVVTVGNGEAAVRRIPDLNPDLVLADIFMPVRNGYEVCEFVKKDERFSHVPVILLVGAFDPLDEKEARRVGADGVLKKPFVPPDPLIAMVMSALEKNPRVAAEMAKAREAKEVLPEPVPQLEIPARAEPKPLPDFPEPTAEEAAMVYGFGKGVRALDDEPSAAKVPVAEAEDEDDADFDGASTSSDWRRNAMDFEVPPESANQPAFSSDDNLEPSTFPSESEVPPRRVRAPDPVEESDPIEQDQTPVATFAVAEVTESSVEQSPAIESAVEESSAPEPFSEPPARIVSADSEVEPASQASAAIESEAKSEPVSSSAHWMDALAPTPSELPSGGWMNSLAEPLPESSSVSYPTDSPVESHEQASLPVESIETRGEQDAAVEVPEPQDLHPVSHALHQQPSFTDPPVPDEAPESWFAPAPSVFESDPDPVSQPIALAKSEPDQGLEIDRVETQSSFAPRDPALVESPAVRVTPEPLLVDSEESHGPSEYGSRPQQVSPSHSFFAPASGDPVVEEAMAAESSSFEQMGAPMPEFAPASSDANGRIPTGPPPSREALAGIPFLMPPPDFGQPMPESGSPNPETIDEVVRKVLAKLEPQIHDLLSQGVLKPLIENILQSELAKKEK